MEWQELEFNELQDISGKKMHMQQIVMHLFKDFLAAATYRNKPEPPSHFISLALAVIVDYINDKECESNSNISITYLPSPSSG